MCTHSAKISRASLTLGHGTHRCAFIRCNIIPAYSSLATPYKDECDRSEADWVAQLTDPIVHRLICVAQPSGDDAPEPLEDGELVGIMTLRGPLKPGSLDFAGRRVNLRSGSESGSGSGSGAPVETLWYGGGLYIQPAHRRPGLMISLHEALLDFLRTYTDEHVPIVMNDIGLELLRSARMCAVVTAASKQAESLYQAMGAQEVGYITRSETQRLAGDANVEDQIGEPADRVCLEMVIAC